jgi:hypothetical protein
MIDNRKSLSKYDLKKEQEELFSLVQTEFWQRLYRNILQEHTYQSDFFLVRENVDKAEAVTYLRNLLNDLSQKYSLSVTEAGGYHRNEFILKLHNYGIISSKSDEVSIVVCLNDITIRMLPHSPLLKIFSIDEFQLAGKILQVLCESIFGDRLEEYVDYLNEYKHIEGCIKGLTPKTIEIVQNSIRCIYEATDEKFKNLIQHNIYSYLRYKGKMIRILHSDFMKDPNVLLKKLKEEKNVSKN